MIESRDLLLFGREEPLTEETRAVRLLVDPWRARAQNAWLYRWEDKPERWDNWNVMMCVGPFGQWRHFDFCEFKGLGLSWRPTLVHRIRYIPLIECADPCPVSKTNPPILLHTTPLLPAPARKPHVQYPYDRLLTSEMRLKKHGLLNHPLALTRRAFDQIVGQMGFAVGEDESGRVELRAVTDADLRETL